jgi:hypothetical protein
MHKNYDLLNLENYKIELETLSKIKSDLSALVYVRIRANTNAYSMLDSFINDIEKKRNKLTEIIKDLSDSNQPEIIELKVKTTLFKRLQTKRTEFRLDSIDKTIDHLINYQNDDIFFNKLTKVEKASSKEFDIEQFKNTKFNIAIAKTVDQIIIYHQDDIYIKNNDIYLDLNNFDIFSQNNLRYLSFSRLFNLYDINIFLALKEQ